MLSKAIETLEDEIVGLRDRTAREIANIHAYLSQPGAKTKLRPRIMQNDGYKSFSIIWHKLVFYDWANRRAKFKEIRKGRGYQVPKSRLMAYCRTCEVWEKEYIWEKELKFARTRKQVALLSQGLQALKRYCALEAGGESEPRSGVPAPASAVPFMSIEEVVKSVAVACRGLHDRTAREISMVSARLGADGRTGLRPGIENARGSEGFTVEWFRRNGNDPVTGQPGKRRIPREGGYSIRRSRLLAHCRGSEAWEQEFIWEQELAFARVRKQAALLSQAALALRRYLKEETDSEGK